MTLNQSLPIHLEMKNLDKCLFYLRFTCQFSHPPKSTPNNSLGNLALSIAAKESICPKSSTGSESSSSVRPLLYVPQIIATIDTGCTSLYDITGLSDEKIWTMDRWSNDGYFSIKLYNLQGELLFSFEINRFSYIALIRSEDYII